MCFFLSYFCDFFSSVLLIFTFVFSFFTESIWTTELDFLFHPRKIYSGITRPIANLSAGPNITHFVGSHILLLPEHPVSLNFCYFTSAFFAFSTRYSAIFWYTNKVLSCIFALQLFWLTVHSLFTFCGMSILYKLSFNHWAYPEIPLLLPSCAVIILYLVGGFFLIISTITIFEYGLHFFEEKFRLVLQRHHPAFGKDYFPISPTTCQGYIPHSCAMVSLVFLALCKGPIIYDLVNVYRFTQSRFVLICVIIDVIYMVLWVALWSVLTLKQSWRFRILDYVSAGHPVFMVPSDHIVRNPSFDQIELAELHRRKKRRHHGSVPSMSTNSDCCDTDTVGTIEEETISQLPPIAEHPRDEQESAMPNGVLVRKMNKARKAGMARVTFDESANRASEDDEPPAKIDLCQDLIERQEINAELYVPDSIDSGQGIDNPCLSVSSMTSIPRDGSQNVSAEVHSPSSEWDTISREHDIIIENGNTTVAVEPNAPSESRESTLSRDYKADLRSKCDIYFNRNSLSLKQENLYVVREEDGGGGGGGGVGGNLQNGHPEHESLVNQRSSTLPSRRGPGNGPSSTNTTNNNDLLKSKLNGSIVQPTDNSAAAVRKSEKISLLEKDKKNFSTFKHSFPSERLKLSSTSLANDTPLPNGHLNRPDIVPNDSNSKFTPRSVHLVVKKPEILRRDSANYSMTSSQDTSSNESEHGGLCSQV